LKIIDIIHSKGINIRYLDVVKNHIISFSRLDSNNNNWIFNLLNTEILARCAKTYIFEKWRDNRCKEEDNLNSAANILQSLFVNQQHFFHSMKLKFDNKFFIKDFNNSFNLSDFDWNFLLTRIQSLTGIELNENILTSNNNFQTKNFSVKQVNYIVKFTKENNNIQNLIEKRPEIALSYYKEQTQNQNTVIANANKYFLLTLICHVNNSNTQSYTKIKEYAAQGMQLLADLGKFIIVEEFNKQILYDYARTVVAHFNDTTQLVTLNNLMDMPDDILILLAFTSIALLEMAEILNDWWEYSENKSNTKALMIAEMILKCTIYFTRLFDINDNTVNSFNTTCLAKVLISTLPYTTSENLANRKKKKLNQH